jgi:hypothetical protein
MTQRIVEPLQTELILEDDETLVNISNEIDEGTQQQAAQIEETAQPDTEEQLDPKYSNKSVAEVARMHQEAERLLGKQGSELGDLRKVVDDYIESNLEKYKSNSPAQPSEPEVDIFDEPDQYVNSRVENNPKIKQMEEFLAQQQKEAVHNKILQKYPNIAETVNDNNFVEWIKSSRVRQELLNRMNNWDFDAADELLGNWDERKEVVSKTASMQEEDKKQQRKKASTGSTKGSSEPSSRKIYRRSDIVNLMINDPERYKANVDEFDRAYREGRVK